MFPGTSRATLVLLGLVAVLLLGGLGTGLLLLTQRMTGPRPYPHVAERGPSKQPPRPARSLPYAGTPLAQLTAVPSGFGLMVGNPVDEHAEANLREFGRGCGRWLHCNTAGHGALGKSLAWSAANGAPNSLQLKHPWLRLEDTPRLVRMFGVTHVALGELTGSAAQCTLTYRLFRVPDKVQVGAPVKLSGSQAAVAKQLPTIARALLRSLEAPAADVPAQPAESAADLATLGALEWNEVGRVPRGRNESDYADVARRSVAMRLLWARREADRGDADSVRYQLDTLLKEAPDNTLVMAEGAHALLAVPRHIPNEPFVAAAQSLLRRYPHNQQLNQAVAELEQLAQHPPEAVRAAEMAVRCSPNNSQVLATLGRTLRDQGGALRGSRFMSDLDQSERGMLDQVYRNGLDVWKRVLELQPENGVYCIELSQAARFAGDAKTAEQALWKGIRLAPGNRYAYWHGLELFSRRWYGDRAKEVKIAALAAHAPFAEMGDRLWMADTLAGRGFQKEAALLLKNQSERKVFKTLRAESAPASVATWGQQLYQHSGAVTAVGWDPAGSRLASVSSDGTLRLWSGPRQEVRVVTPRGGQLTALAWNPDGRYLAISCQDQSARVLDASTGAEVRALRGHTEPLFAVAWHPDRARMATGGGDKSIRLWSASGEEEWKLGSSLGSVYHVSYNPDGTLLMALSRLGDDKTLAGIWDVVKLRRMRVLQAEAGGIMYDVAWSPDGTKLVSGSHDGKVRTWSVRALKLLQISASKRPIYCVAWSPDGSEIAAGGEDCTVRIWDAATGVLKHQWVASRYAVKDLAWKPDGRFLAAGGSDGRVSLWELSRAPAAGLSPPGTAAAAPSGRAPVAH